MPCYTAWNEHLTEGSPDHERARAALDAKLSALKHVVIYYHDALRVRLPEVRLVDDEKELERENRELRRANEILKKAPEFDGARSSSRVRLLVRGRF